MESTPERTFVVGLDLGSNSVGWAAVSGTRPDESGSFTATGLLRVGSRIFEAAVDGSLEQIEQGREKSLNEPRRQARGQRRGTERRGRRLHQLYRRLSRAGLLPALPSLADDPKCGEWQRGKSAAAQRREQLALARERDTALKALDRDLWAQHRGAVIARDEGDMPRQAHVLPYLLRARALDARLEPFELGRALYHLGQRRGFLSNRKAAPKDEDEGTVKKHIGELAQAIETAGARTLGEYFSRTDPESARIRGQYTSRAMYEREFHAIWSAQRQHHAELLTDRLRDELHRAIFYQRPLKSQAHLIGACEHEPKRKRAPKAILAFQRFRVLQTVNHTKVSSADGEVRWLSEKERADLVARLEQVERLKFIDAKKLLGIPRNSVFGFEGGGETAFRGNVTAARIGKAIGKRWDALSDADRDRLVEDVLTIQRPEVLARRGVRHWGLEDAAAQALAGVKLEAGHANLSRQALRKLLPLMERGLPYMSAVMEVYGRKGGGQPLERLPPVRDAMPQITNPAVLRTLSEMRKVVNALIRQHGKPELIRVELARDLRNPPGARQKMSQRNRKFEQLREAASKRAREYLRDEPRPADIEKVLLADECNWHCPYTGTGFGMEGLLGSHPVVDIEHIIPRSRSLDNSFLNKTLCLRSENHVKRNRTPWEAYAHTRKWEDLLLRVKGFRDIRGDGTAKRKLEWFMLDSEQVQERFGDFTARQLTDTRYASRLAMQYLGLLYGGTVDTEGRLRIQVTRGMATSDMRVALRLNRILGDGGAKTRNDHRHHAVDSVAIALTTPAMLKAMSDAARDAELSGRRPVPFVPYPWETFPQDVQKAVHSAKTSYRVSTRVRGALHKETIYGPPFQDGGKTHVHVRKALSAMSVGEVAQIVDASVREAVEAKLAAVGGDPKKLDLINDPPLLSGGNGRTVPIRKARIKLVGSPFSIGDRFNPRHVLTDTNHHVEVLEVSDKKGGVKWVGEMVTRFEAYRRWKAGDPIVQRDHGDDRRFLFSLSPGECVALQQGVCVSRIVRVRGVSWKARGYVEVEFVEINDARKKSDIKTAKQWGSNPLETLRRWGCRKVKINPLGDVYPCND